MNKEEKAWGWLAHIVLLLLSLVSLLPLMLLFMASISDEASITQNGYSFLPQKFSLDAYKYLFEQSSQIVNAYGITILITIVGTSVGLMMTALLAFALSRKELPLRRFFTFLVFFTMLFNGGLVPTYWIYTQTFQLKNTIWSLIIPYLLMQGFGVMVMRTFFMTTIPEDILDAARIDGAGEFRTFGQIVLPMSMPIMATIGLLKAIGYWNDWFNGMIFLTNPALFSIQNLLNRILADLQFLATSDLANRAPTMALPSATVRMAIAVIGVIPILILYPFFQKYFVKGLTIGGMKG